MKRRIESKEWIRQYKSTHPCVDCGETDPIVLDFDHVQGDKCDSIAALTHNRMSLKTIQLEIDKCVIRCANCHRRRHHRETLLASEATLVAS